jgi:hypothetical protein
MKTRKQIYSNLPDFQKMPFRFAMSIRPESTIACVRKDVCGNSENLARKYQSLAEHEQRPSATDSGFFILV